MNSRYTQIRGRVAFGKIALQIILIMCTPYFERKGRASAYHFFPRLRLFVCVPLKINLGSLIDVSELGLSLKGSVVLFVSSPFSSERKLGS